MFFQAALGVRGLFATSPIERRFCFVGSPNAMFALPSPPPAAAQHEAQAMAVLRHRDGPGELIEMVVGGDGIELQDAQLGVGLERHHGALEQSSVQRQ
jgi:hypothetical protein